MGTGGGGGGGGWGTRGGGGGVMFWAAANANGSRWAAGGSWVTGQLGHWVGWGGTSWARWGTMVGCWGGGVATGKRVGWWGEVRRARRGRSRPAGGARPAVRAAAAVPRVQARRGDVRRTRRPPRCAAIRARCRWSRSYEELLPEVMLGVDAERFAADRGDGVHPASGADGQRLEHLHDPVGLGARAGQATDGAAGGPRDRGSGRRSRSWWPTVEGRWRSSGASWRCSSCTGPGR